MKRKCPGVRTAFEKLIPRLKFLLFPLIIAGAFYSCAPKRAEVEKIPAVPPEAVLSREKLKEIKGHYKKTGNLKVLFRKVKHLCKEFPGAEACPEGWFFILEVMFEKGHWKDLLKVGSFFLERWEERPEASRVRYFMLNAFVKRGEIARVAGIEREIDEKVLLPHEKAHLTFIRAEIAFITHDFETALQECIYLTGFENPFSEACRGIIEEVMPFVSYKKLESFRDHMVNFSAYPLIQIARAEEEAHAGRLKQALKILKRVKSEGDPRLEEEIRRIVEDLARAISPPGGPVFIGVIIPFQGPLARVGQKILKSVFFAYEHTDISHDLHVVIEDSGKDAHEAVRAFFRLFSKGKPAVVVGPVSADYILALSRHAEVFEMPIIGITRVEGLARGHPYLFRAHVSSSRLVSALVDWAVGKHRMTRFAILYPRDGYGVFMRDLFWETAKSRGAKIVIAKSYRRSRTDIISDIKKMVGTFYVDVFEKQAKEKGEELPPDFEPPPHIEFQAIFIPESAVKGAFIARELAYADVMGVQLLGPELWNDPKFIKIGENFVEGAVFADGFFADSQVPEVSEFVRRFSEEYVEKPDTLEAYTSAIVSALLKYIDTKDKGGERLRNFLLRGKIPFPGGWLSFDSEGELIHPVKIISVEGGRFVEME